MSEHILSKGVKLIKSVGDCMRTTRRRSIIVSFVTLTFLVGIGSFVYKFITNGNIWALSPVNKHFSSVSLGTAGDILDTNGVVLAHSENGKRIYHNDATLRKAVLHTVGDNSTHIATAVQTLYRDELYGYNFIFGTNFLETFSQPKNIQLTIDSELCKKALTLLGSHRGAVCLYNYKTGEILCMVSAPTYDPYHPEVVTEDKLGLYEGAYINRVLSSSYAPGSVMKLVTSAAGLEAISNLEGKTFDCQRTKMVNNKKITCMAAHGDIALKEAMKDSCNIYFADLAIELGKKRMTQTANELGFNRSFSFDRIATKKSVYDVHNADDYNLGWSGVGQYNDLLNPMHSVILMGAIANSGTAVLPRFIKDIYVDKVANSDSYSADVATETLMPQDIADKLKEMMRYNVEKNYGDSMFPGLNVCAKTGTAEVGENKKPHGWMVGFSANEKTPLAFSVMVENSGYGSKTAGPIASAIMKSAAKSHFSTT